jgi:hypothetical protein
MHDADDTLVAERMQIETAYTWRQMPRQPKAEEWRWQSANHDYPLASREDRHPIIHRHAAAAAAAAADSDHLKKRTSVLPTNSDLLTEVIPLPLAYLKSTIIQRYKFYRTAIIVMLRREIAGAKTG